MNIWVNFSMCTHREGPSQKMKWKVTDCYIFYQERATNALGNTFFLSRSMWAAITIWFFPKHNDYIPAIKATLFRLKKGHLYNIRYVLYSYRSISVLLGFVVYYFLQHSVNQASPMRKTWEGAPWSTVNLWVYKTNYKYYIYMIPSC